MCLERPLSRACSLRVVETMTSALHRFLPPACAPVPAVYDRTTQNTPGGLNTQSQKQHGVDLDLPTGTGGTEEELANQPGTGQEQDQQVQPMHLETIIVEGGEAEN
ncbi:hypothetical protein ElyMa_003495100 [Elysia marginata]|uniref:Uncharacterized protein n=1 Tax=Elysia marginata TaxID=1093978 RepID=A0AAV4EF54_9GAST|nr:hypothetical protein ElyMa_003495100 [Elysia marginata]